MLTDAVYDALYRAHGDARFPRDRVNPSRFGAEGSDGRLDTRTHPRSPEHLSLRTSSRKPLLYSLLDHRSLKFSEDATHLKKRLAGGRSRIDSLLVQIKIDALTVHLVEEVDQMLQAATQAIDRPGGEDVEFFPHGCLVHLVESRALITPFGTAEPMIHVLTVMCTARSVAGDALRRKRS